MSIIKGGIKMPGRDGTGPMGMGALLVRGSGFCGNGFYGRKNCYGMGFIGRGRGFGYGPRYGYGSGSGYGLRPDITEKEFLEKQKELLKSQINIIERELDNFDD